MEKRENQKEQTNVLGFPIWKIVVGVIMLILFLIVVNWGSIKDEWNDWNKNRDIARVEELKNNYIEACEGKDFEEAYKIINQIKTIDPWEAPKAEKYVVLHEATHVLETEGVNGLTRISFIAKEHNASWLYNQIMGIAKSINDDNLTLQIVKKWNLWDDETIQRLLDEGNKSDAMTILRKVGSFGLPAINTRLGAYRDETGISKKIARYNAHCRYIVEYAITHKDKDLANEAFMMMKKNLYLSDWGEVQWYTDDDKNEVQKIIENAEKLGAFK
ncbi:MAG: hypothetical protein MJZ32_07365 [Bacteroidaceae bacterium]|nr:hypothetical protein [Bacteroidaceae bacterium]